MHFCVCVSTSVFVFVWSAYVAVAACLCKCVFALLFMRVHMFVLSPYGCVRPCAPVCGGVWRWCSGVWRFVEVV